MAYSTPLVTTRPIPFLIRKAADSHDICRVPNPCLPCILSDYNQHSTVTGSFGIDQFSILSPFKKTCVSLYISDNVKSKHNMLYFILFAQ